jgi:hypothetical protein
MKHLYITNSIKVLVELPSLLNWRCKDASYQQKCPEFAQTVSLPLPKGISNSTGAIWMHAMKDGMRWEVSPVGPHRDPSLRAENSKQNAGKHRPIPAKDTNLKMSSIQRRNLR